MKARMFALMLAALLTPLAASAQEAVATTAVSEVPTLSQHVMDNAQALGADAARLEQRLADYERRTGHQFAVLTVPTLGSDSIEQYAERVFREWKLGDAKRDDGVLFVCALADRKMRIEVGYGLEGVITDAASKRALDELARPAFRASKYADGIEAVFERLMGLADAEAVAGEASVQTVAPSEHAEEDFPVGALLTILLGLAALSLMFRRSDGAEYSAPEPNASVERELNELRRSAVADRCANPPPSNQVPAPDQAANDAACMRMFAPVPGVARPAPVRAPAAPVHGSSSPPRSTRVATPAYESSASSLLDVFASSSSSSISSSSSSDWGSSSSSSDDSGGWGGGGGSSGGGGASSDW